MSGHRRRGRLSRPYGSTGVIGLFDTLGKFKQFGWYMIVGWAKLASQPEHPFVDPVWIDGPGQGVWKVDSEQEPVLVARRALFV